MKRWVFLAVTLGIMALIFWLSGQTGETSGQFSDRVAETIEAAGARIITPGIFSANQKANIRKWAHIYVYGALGVSMALTVHAWHRRGGLRRQALLACALCTLYAASDELHQYFVPGRAMQLSDVAVDALGFAPCLLAVFLLLFFWQRRKKTPETQ